MGRHLDRRVGCVAGGGAVPDGAAGGGRRLPTVFRLQQGSGRRLHPVRSQHRAAGPCRAGPGGRRASASRISSAAWSTVPGVVICADDMPATPASVAGRGPAWRFPWITSLWWRDLAQGIGPGAPCCRDLPCGASRARWGSEWRMKSGAMLRPGSMPAWRPLASDDPALRPLAGAAWPQGSLPDRSRRRHAGNSRMLWQQRVPAVRLPPMLPRPAGWTCG